VFVSGMHIQRQQMKRHLPTRARLDLPVALGGPSVSACPDYYPSFDYLHVGELGDATNELLARLARDCSRPAEQVVFKTADRIAMSEFPIPAMNWPRPRSISRSIQYSSGCPYQCEFCDIPGLYGRNPRLKTPQQIIAELEKLRECGMTDTIYFRRRQFHRQPQRRRSTCCRIWSNGRSGPATSRAGCEATLTSPSVRRSSIRCARPIS